MPLFPAESKEIAAYTASETPKRAKREKKSIYRNCFDCIIWRRQRNILYKYIPLLFFCQKDLIFHKKIWEYLYHSLFFRRIFHKSIYMQRKTLIIIGFILALFVGMFIYFSYPSTDIDISFWPKATTKHTSTGIVEETGSIQTGSEWNPKVMRTETITNDKDIKVEITTNGPPMREMTPEEKAAFDKKFQK